MHWDTMVDGIGHPLASAASAAERDGYGGVFVPELIHDPFIAASSVALSTERATVGTQIAVAFARSPMTVAHSAHDLQELSSGRFVLGLGTQVAAHITRRYSMPWSQPARRMSEYIGALRAIWSSWRTGERLDFQGDFYTHTLTSPRFIPPVSNVADPAVWLAAVGPRMAQVAGERADGIVLHGFTTARYAREVVLPAVDRGLAKSGRTRNEFTVSVPAMVVSGADSTSIEESRRTARALVAFYGSTPSYREVLALDGWGDVADELHALSRDPNPDRWTAMAQLVTDEILDAFAVEASPEELPTKTTARFTGVADRISLAKPVGVSTESWREILRSTKGAA